MKVKYLLVTLVLFSIFTSFAAANEVMLNSNTPQISIERKNDVPDKNYRMMLVYQMGPINAKYFTSFLKDLAFRYDVELKIERTGWIFVETRAILKGKEDNVKTVCKVFLMELEEYKKKGEF